MPIDPKQQPPYYKTSLSPNGTTLQVLFQQLTPEATVDTTPIEAGKYTIPANTWLNNQIIEVTYWGNAYNSATGVEKSIWIDGNGISLTNVDFNLNYSVKIKMTRNDTTLYYLIESLIEGEPTDIRQGSLTPDFTQSIEIYIDLTAGTTGNIRLSQAYIIKF